MSLVKFSNYISLLYKYIKQRGLKDSPSREYILKVLYENNYSMNVQQILEKVNEESPREVSLNTLYRSLRVLEDSDLIKVINIKNQNKDYVINTFNQSTIYLQCDICGATIREESSNLENSLLTLLEDNDFKRDAFYVVVKSQCQKC